MNIWTLNHYADTPDRQATRSYDLGKQLVERGHRVTIFAAGFSHYSFREERIRPGETWREEDCNGVRFVWLKTFPYRANDWRRVLNMFSYAWRAFWLGRKRAEKPDAIIGVSVHPLAALAAYLVARTRGARFFFEVTDLWPETLIEFGKLERGGILARALRALERFLYRRSEKIIMLLGHTQEYVRDLGVDPKKIVWIPNGVDLSRYEALHRHDGTFTEPFTIMYVGGLVASNRIDVILEAAQIHQAKGRNSVRFIFVGDGTDKDRLVRRAQELGLFNVEFRGLVPKRKVAEAMAEADAFVFCLQDLSLYRYGISLNKMCDYLASGRPTLFAGDSAYNPVLEAGAGICVPPENPEALADAIDRLISLTAEERLEMGRNGIEHLRKNHDMRILADRLERVLLGEEQSAPPETASVLPQLKSTT